MGKKEIAGNKSKLHEVQDEHVEHEKKRKNKHRSKGNDVVNDGVEEEKSEMIDQHEKKKKAKRKDTDSKNRDDEGVNHGKENDTEEKRNGVHEEKTILDLIDDEMQEKKAKKKKRKKDKEKILSGNFLAEGGQQTVNPSGENEQKFGSELAAEEELVECKENSKTKKKKKRKRDADDIVIENTYAVDENDNVPKKKKKKLKNEREEQATVSEVNVQVHSAADDERKKKKKRSVGDTKTGHDSLESSPKLQKDNQMEDELVTTDTDKGVKKHKKKLKKEKLPEKVNSIGETEVKSKKVADEQLDEPATRADFKKELQEVKPSTMVGQWGTAQFENAERQNKFLRLLGGMKKKSNVDSTGEKKEKKGLFGGLAALCTKSGNSAMTSEEQTKWRTNIESQFNKALEYKGQKGGGLGFEKPPEGKKFHINIHKSNSIKFDD